MTTKKVVIHIPEGMDIVEGTMIINKEPGFTYSQFELSRGDCVVVGLKKSEPDARITSDAYVKERCLSPIPEKESMRNDEGQELVRVLSGKIKPGRYYTDIHHSAPIKWYGSTDTFPPGDAEDTKVWKVKK